LRLQLLKTYGENEWKKRVKSPNDAEDFSIEGKLRQAGMFFSSHQKPNKSRKFRSGKISTPTDEQKPIPTSTRKTPTLKYSAKKTNTDQLQRAKTVDVVRLKTG
jgi:hypothetical protein